MRRFGAFLLVLAFVSVPLLQVRCLIACASEDVQQSADTCHQHAAEDGVTVKIGDHHDCGAHPTSVVFASDTRPATMSPGPTSVAVAPTLSGGSAAAIAPAASPTGGPPGRFLVPLRL